MATLLVSRVYYCLKLSYLLIFTFYLTGLCTLFASWFVMMANFAFTGNLQFVNIIADDSKNGQTYTCVAENKIMRSIQQGEYNTISPRGGKCPSLTHETS
jgi:hypothetical protein